MQALRTGALAQGSMRAIRGGTRASTGRGWYQRYQRMGPDAFRKARAPNPFDWEASGEDTRSDSEGKLKVGPDRRKRRRAFFELAVDGVSAGRVEFELAADLLPVTCENFLRLCTGVDLAPLEKTAVRLSASMGEDGGVAQKEDAGGVEESQKLGYEGTMVRVCVSDVRADWYVTAVEETEGLWLANSAGLFTGV